MDTITHNRSAWNQRVREGKSAYTQPVSPEQVEAARKGDWNIHVTPSPVPKPWLGDVEGQDVLCLASGGGQQGPVLAAASANVTVFDLSDEQLAQDRLVAERDGLEIRTVQGDMRDLSAFADASFDLIVHPVSNCFIPDVNPVWREAYRVLRPGGRLISGMVNPLLYAVGGRRLFKHPEQDSPLRRRGVERSGAGGTPRVGAGAGVWAQLERPYRRAAPGGLRAERFRGERLSRQGHQRLPADALRHLCAQTAGLASLGNRRISAVIARCDVENGWNLMKQNGCVLSGFGGKRGASEPRSPTQRPFLQNDQQGCFIVTLR